MDKKVRLMRGSVLGLALLPGLAGPIGCSGGAPVAESKEGVRPRDEQQKAREYGGDPSKAVPQKGRGR